MKIVNMKRFIRSVIFILGVFILLTIIFTSKSFSHGDITYKKIFVSYGDTLWTIAKEEKNSNNYFENKDIREIVYELQTTNNLKNSNLKVGQELNVPII